MSVACFSVTQIEGSDLFGQLLIRGRVIERGVVVRWNSQRYARCFPRWWIAGSGDLNSYKQSSALNYKKGHHGSD